MDYPKTQIEFEQMFSNEEKCLLYLSKLRFKQGYICPKCKGQQYWKSKKGMYVCKQCNYQLSLTAGTIFHKSRIELTVLFRVIWHIVIASLLKRWLLGTHQNFTSPVKLNYYLDEFVFRYNRRFANSRGLLFQTLIQQALIKSPESTVNTEKKENN